jgi:hypothetical protein
MQFSRCSVNGDLIVNEAPIFAGFVWVGCHWAAIWPLIVLFHRRARMRSAHIIFLRYSI